MKPVLLLALACSAAMACTNDGGPPPAEEPEVAKVELLENPEFIFSPDFRSRAVEVQGVALGDLKAEIPCNLEEVNDLGWYRCRSDERGARFRIRNGRVHELSPGKEFLEKMDIRSPEDIEKKFGPADRVENKRTLFSRFVMRRTFIYEDRGLKCGWYFVINDPHVIIFD